MNPLSNTLPPGTKPSQDATSSRAYTPGLSDGLGDRLMTFDTATQSSVELLRFKREFSDAPGFEETLRARVEELSSFKHASIAAVRGVETLDDGIALVSVNTAGRRLSEMVHVARGAPFAMDLIQQLAPALSALHQSGARVSHGLLTAERIIITREGRLIVVEHVLASAFEQLRLSSTRLRTEFGIAVPTGSDPVALNQRSDVVQLGFLALSLLLGRRLDPAHYPANLATLLDEFTQADPQASARLRPWLERALQIGAQPFASAQEAHTAFAGPSASTTAGKATEKSADKTSDKTSDKTTDSGSSPSSVLAFRPADGGAAQTKAKGDTGKVGSSSDARTDQSYSGDLAKSPTPIGLQRETPSSTPMVPMTPIPSVASPRARSGNSGSGKWIAIAGAAMVAVAGGLYFAGVFSGTPSPSTEPTNPAPPPTATIPAPAPPPFRPPSTLPAGATPPANATEPTAVPLANGSGSSSTTGNALAAGVTGGAAAATPGKDSTTKTAAASTTQAPAPDKTAPAVGGIGGVKVNAPVELQVFENGNLIGSTAGQIAVLAGSHTFDLVNESLSFRVRSTVLVKGGQLTPLNVNLPNGRVSINAVPWADVTIDGRAVGQTPLANLAVQIGQHLVVFKHPQFGEQQQTVIVKAEGLAKVSATFKQ
jgi:hypothetical protein